MGFLNFLLYEYYQSLFYFLAIISIVHKKVAVKVVLAGSIFLGISEYLIINNIKDAASGIIGFVFNIVILSFFVFSLNVAKGSTTTRISKCFIIAILAFVLDAVTQLIVVIPLSTIYSVSSFDVATTNPVITHLSYKSLQIFAVILIWEGEFKYAKKFLQKSN